MLASPEFNATEAQKAFLQFVVGMALTGKSDEIKGYTVATQVFGRREDFDQSTDPVVSIHANKLRRALERYYLVAGRHDPVRIDMPKGGYVPTFLEQTRIETNGASFSDEGTTARFEGSWPVLVVHPFHNWTGDPELNHLAVGLATELAVEITRYQDIQVLLCRPERREAQNPPDRIASFALEGSIRKDKSGVKVSVELIDLSTGIQSWGEMYKSGPEAAQTIAFQERVAKLVAAKIAGEFGIIARAFSAASKNLPASDLKTYEAFLRYYQFNSSFSEKTFQRAFEALKFATSKDPECGLAWSMLGRLYAGNYSLELFDVDTPLEEAVSFARKGVRLDPASQRVRGILAYVLLLNGNIAEGLAQVDRGVALNPDSFMYMDNFGYLLTLLGDWERGPALIREAIRHNPFYSIIVHYALWVNWIRQEAYEQAHMETQHFGTPLLFWDPLIKAAGFGLLGRIEEGRQAARDLLRLKPDFQSRGRTLIEHYIKFEEIVERMLEGLSKVGVSIGA